VSLSSSFLFLESLFWHTSNLTATSSSISTWWTYQTIPLLRAAEWFVLSPIGNERYLYQWLPWNTHCVRCAIRVIGPFLVSKPDVRPLRDIDDKINRTRSTRLGGRHASSAEVLDCIICLHGTELSPGVYLLCSAIFLT
jgi:hypothetical protein